MGATCPHLDYDAKGGRFGLTKSLHRQTLGKSLQGCGSDDFLTLEEVLPPSTGPRVNLWMGQHQRSIAPLDLELGMLT